jgi:hypothetical protein
MMHVTEIVNVVENPYVTEIKNVVENPQYQNLIENPQEEQKTCECPVCYTHLDEYFITECNHAFCKPCLIQVKVFHEKIYGAEKFPCPLCRELIPNSFVNINVKVQLPPFVSTNYPLDPDFSCISSEHVRRMVQSAYECVQIQEKWLLLYQYNVDETRGFMFATSPEINDLMSKIDDHYQGGHSGCSMGMTMRMIHYIAIYGFYRFNVLVT